MQEEKVKNRVEELRKKLGWTQEELADKAKVGQSTVSEIENEVGLPYIDTALYISRALNETIDKVFYLEEDE